MIANTYGTLAIVAAIGLACLAAILLIACDVSAAGITHRVQRFWRTHLKKDR